LHKQHQSTPNSKASLQATAQEHGTHSKLHLMKNVRRGSSKAVHKTAHAFSHFFQAIEEFAFPRSTSTSPLSQHVAAPKVRGGVLLQGCDTAEEHYAQVHAICHDVKDLHGREGLIAAGLEYRTVACDEHAPAQEEQDDDLDTTSHTADADGQDSEGLLLQRLGTVTRTNSPPDLVGTTITSSVRTVDSLVYCSTHTPPPATCSDAPFCHLCSRRLFHKASNTAIDEDNRKKFIADGDMYEQITRLCQEYAHKVMCEEGRLEWVLIEEADGKEPIRALVNYNHPLIQHSKKEGCRDKEPSLVGRPTLLIATGKGKVRAGIFSRQHLMCTGIESATALPIVREAVARSLNVVIVDPNVHGDSLGMVTFEKTMAGLFGARWESTVAGEDEEQQQPTGSSSVAPLQSRDLYIISHSASGSQLARYLLEKSDHYLPHIKAIAFTDSTHNIQWCKTADNEDLYHKLQSPECVYFRCASVRRDGNQWYLHSAGEKIQTDSFWQRRFGNIQTYWAGTNEHSLTNWYAHTKIWEHFDRYLGRIDEASEREEAGADVSEREERDLKTK
jgi:hypothetical protein